MGLGAWIALLLCILAGGATTVAWARRVGVLGPAIVGLAAQGAVTVGLYVMAGLWAPDAVVYDQIGQEIAAYWVGGPAPSLVTNGKEAFPVVLGGIYLVVGHAPPIGLAMNWLAHGVLVVMTACLARRVCLPVRLTAWIVALAPPLLLWSALLLRETITWILLIAFVYALVGVARRINVSDLAIIVATLAALMWFRGTAAIVLAAAGMVAMIVTANRRTVWPRFGVSVLALAVLAPRLTAVLNGYTSIADIEEKRSILIDTASSSFGSSGSDTASDEAGLAASVLESAVRVTVGPFPWEWMGLGVPFALDAILWLMILSFAAWGWWRSPNRWELLLLVLPALGLLAALVITSGNYGTMQRLRVQTTVLLIPLVAAGASSVALRVKERRTTTHRRSGTGPMGPGRDRAQSPRRRTEGL